MIPMLLIFTAIIAFYFYAKKCNNYWTERRVSVVRTNFLFGISFDLLTKCRSLEQIFEDVYHRAESTEPYVGVYNMLRPLLFLRDPELIHRITVKDFNHFRDREKALTEGSRLIYSVASLQGDEWKSVRNKLAPTFSSSKLKKMCGLIEECGEMLAEQHLRPFVESGKPIDVKEVTARFSTDVIGKCVFGMQFNTMLEADSFYREVGKTLNDSGFKNLIRLVFHLVNPNLLKFLGIKLTDEKVDNFFFNLLHDAEELRRQERGHRDDFLQLMLNIKDESGNKSSHLFTENHVASNMSVFYFAGLETTSLTISFALYELTLHSEMQEKLRDEIKKALAANHGRIDYGSIKNLAYLEMVVSETLRLHGPTPFTSRLCTETYRLPGSSLEVKAGQMLYFSLSAIHKDEKYFPNPLKFDPERFSPENSAKMNPYAYQPFGSGPRVCIGLRFAKLVIKICLVFVISRFKLSPCEKTEVPVILKKGGLLHSPQNGIWLTVEEI